MQLSETGNFALRQIMTESAGLGTVVALVMSGNLSPYIKKADAYERFGRYRVDKWIQDGLITIIKDGNHSATWRIDVIELEILSRSLKIIDFVNY